MDVATTHNMQNLELNTLNKYIIFAQSHVCSGKIMGRLPLKTSCKQIKWTCYVVHHHDVTLQSERSSGRGLFVSSKANHLES